MIEATLYSDPGCPWAYSESPALHVLAWRYGEQLAWRLVLIGLTEHAEQYLARGYTPLRSAQGQLDFRRYGMPFSPQPKERVAATTRPTGLGLRRCCSRLSPRVARCARRSATMQFGGRQGADRDQRRRSVSSSAAPSK